MRGILVLTLATFLSTNAYAAIAHVETDTQSNNGLATITETTHTGGGDGTVTLACVLSDTSTDANQTVSSVTMNGVAMDQAVTLDTGVTRVDIWYKVAGTAGDITATMAGVCTGLSMITTTYSGVATTQFNTTGSDGEASGTVVGTSLNTTVDNTMIALCYGNSISGSTWAPDGSQDERADFSSGQMTLGSSDLAVPSATSQAIGATAANSGVLSMAAVAITPAATNNDSMFGVFE